MENPAQFQHYQIRGSADKEDEGVQWEAICDCFPSEDEENEEELRRLALSTGQIIMDNNCICTLHPFDHSIRHCSHVCHGQPNAVLQLKESNQSHF